MNDPDKCVSVNFSSLLSLKAELLRKQQEVKISKLNNASPNQTVTSTKLNRKTKHLTNTEVVPNEKSVELETRELENSRRVLNAKTKFYEQMTNSGSMLNDSLVMFDRKVQSQNPKLLVDVNSDDDDYDEIDYVDCLGRTRKCLRAELQILRQRDQEFAKSLQERKDQPNGNCSTDNLRTESCAELPSGSKPSETIFKDTLSTISKHDEQRLNWECQELENSEKSNVYYQNLFFDEARTHGVGYYSFSKIESERKQQQQDLANARQSTMAEQERRDEIRSNRDQIVSNRVLAAKNRILARKGLPSISKEEYESQLQKKCPKTNVQNIKEESSEDEEDRVKRKKHVREWDKDKKLMLGESKEAWTYVSERLPYSQHEWNETQRAVRKPEFAPLSNK